MTRFPGSPIPERCRRRVAIVATTLAALLGCPTPPRPQALDDLGLMVDSPVAAEAGARAPDAVAEARDLQERAEDAWEDGDVTLCTDLALLAQVKVRLAVSLARQSLARERTDEAERTLAEAEAAYREIEARRAPLEERLARLWAFREQARAAARERTREVEEEALEGERLAGAEAEAWDAEWRARARTDAAEARVLLAQALMLGAAGTYPEAARMAVEGVDTAVAAVETSPYRIERPLADYAAMQADEMAFRMLSLSGDAGPDAYTRAAAALVETYRTGFDPPFNVRLDPHAAVLALDAKAAEIQIAFPGPIERALADLRAKWTADPSLLCLVAVRSLDPECGDGCVEKTEALARRFAGAIGPGGDGSRIRTLGLGIGTDRTTPSGVSLAGAVRIEIRLFPALEIPASATPGHTSDVTAGSQ